MLTLLPQAERALVPDRITVSAGPESNIVKSMQNMCDSCVTTVFNPAYIDYLTTSSVFYVSPRAMGVGQF